jgi:hypothetical protein
MANPTAMRLLRRFGFVLRVEVVADDPPKASTTKAMQSGFSL